MIILSVRSINLKFIYLFFNFCWGNQGQVGLENPHLVKSQNHILNRTDDTDMTASFSDRELKYLWTWAWFTPYNASIRKTPPTARVQKV